MPAACCRVHGRRTAVGVDFMEVYSLSPRCFEIGTSRGPVGWREEAMSFAAWMVDMVASVVAERTDGEYPDESGRL
jgi:hypothetical protein